MTSDGNALFRAVCETPGDDTPRLVYADWLEESGQPERAEFIRLQCEAWHKCSDYPDESSRRTRASQLLARFGDGWYAAIPAVPGVEWGSLFVRGFIDVARIRSLGEVTGTLESVFAAAPLRSLLVDRLKPGQLRDLLAFPLLARLVTLRLPGTQGREEARLLTEARLRFPDTEID